MIIPNIFSEKIFYYESVIPNVAELLYLIESTDSETREGQLISPWQPWKASDDTYVFGQRKTTDVSVYSESSDKLKNIFTTLTDTFDTYVNDYSSKLQIPSGSKMPISISKYFTGSAMGRHTDSSPIPTSHHVSAVIYLNDNYSGGELRFPDQGVTIKPSAGSLVIFPSVPPFYHESLEIKNGVKYMSPAFWHLTN